MAARRRCPARGCPQLVPAGTRYCPTHLREYDTRRGTPTQRGYDATHRAERTSWAKRIAAGECPICPRCHRPITNPHAFDLGHPTGRTGGRMPEHPACNRSEGGRRGRAAQAANRDD